MQESGGAKAGHGGDASKRPLITYDVTWVVDPVAARTGSLNGLCPVPGGVGAGAFGFNYHFIGRDATGAVVDNRFVCIAFSPADPTQRPPLPAELVVPTFGEAWNAAQLPAPVVSLDPASRGITGLETRISTDGPTSETIAARVRGFEITGTATLDHYEISVDGGAATEAANDRYTFETKGNHTIAISAVWHGVATLSGPQPLGTIGPVDIGTATITSTRTYTVNEVRSVLQP